MRGYTMNKDDYIRRLRRIEGQVRGLQRMIEEDARCVDVLTQMSSVTNALRGVALGLVNEHLGHCVRTAAEDDPEGADQLIEEATRAIERLVRS